MLFPIVKDPYISANDLNHDLDVINSQIIFNGTVVAKVEEQKQLGLLLESNLSFVKHLGLLLESNLSFVKHLSEKIKGVQNIGIIFLVFYPLNHLGKCIKLVYVPILVVARTT